MNNYETVILLNSELSKEERNNVILKIREEISNNGKVEGEEDKGLRKLAYEIKNNKQAYYYIFEFSSESTFIAELERIFRITDEILKFIVVRKDD